MRTKLLLMVFVFAVTVTRVYAAQGDGVNAVIPLSTTADFIARNAGGSDVILRFIGSLTPAGSYKIWSDQLDRFANQLQTSADTDLNPAFMQENETHDTSEARFYQTSRLCVKNPETGAIEADVVSNQTIKTEHIPGLTIMNEHGTAINSMIGSGTIGLNRKTTEDSLPPGAALPCTATIENAGDLPQKTAGYTDANTYGNGNTIVSFFMRTLGAVGGQQQANPDSYIVATGYTQHGKEIHDNVSGDNSLVASYQPAGLKYISEVNGCDHSQQWTAFGQTITAAGCNAYEKELTDGLTALNCNLIPVGGPTNGLDCSKSWGAAISDLSGGNYMGTCPASELAKINASSTWLPFPPPFPPSGSPALYLKFFDWIAATFPSDTHRDTSKLPNPTAVACLAAYADKYWGGNQFRAHLNQTINWALQHHWNPSLFMSLWLEESHAGQRGREYGCGAQNTNTPDQFACLNTVTINVPFYRFMCMYAGDCPDNDTQTTNWESFPSVIQFYNILTNWHP